MLDDETLPLYRTREHRLAQVGVCKTFTAFHPNRSLFYATPSLKVIVYVSVLLFRAFDFIRVFIRLVSMFMSLPTNHTTLLDSSPNTEPHNTGLRVKIQY